MKIDVFMIGLRHVHGVQGGIETHVRHLAKELTALGLTVAVAVRKPRGARSRIREALRVDPTEDDSTITIVPIWCPRIVAFAAIIHSLLCVVYAAVVRPRVVHIHAIGPSIVAPLARLLGLHVIATHHGQDYRREKWGIIARFVLRTGEVMQALAAQEIVCVSKPLCERLGKRYRRKYTYIPNGVSEFKTSAPSTILDDLGLLPNRYVLTVGRIVPEKRHDDLIAAFRTARLTDMNLVIVGAGEAGSDHVSKLAGMTGSSPGVIMAGFREGADLSTLYANAAVFVLPSSHEGLPIVLLEAMAHGREVVVSDIEPHRELALTEESYHAVGDIGDLAMKIRTVATRSTSKDRDWSVQLRPYRWQLIARQILDVLRLANHRVAQASSAETREIPARPVPSATISMGALFKHYRFAEPQKSDITPLRRGNLSTSSSTDAAG